MQRAVWLLPPCPGHPSRHSEPQSGEFETVETDIRMWGDVRMGLSLDLDTIRGNCQMYERDGRSPSAQIGHDVRFVDGCDVVRNNDGRLSAQENLPSFCYACGSSPQCWLRG